MEVSNSKICFPVINMTFQLFGAHVETVDNEWKWPSEHHPAFEMMYILDGKQKTYTETGNLIINTGEFAIIPMEVEHSSFNIGNKPMRYFSMHFNLDDPRIRYLLSINFSGKVITKDEKYYEQLKQQVDSLIKIVGNKNTITERLIVQIQVIEIINILVSAAYELSQFNMDENDVNNYMLYQKIAGELKDELNFRVFHEKNPVPIRVNTFIQNYHISQSKALSLFKKFSGTSVKGYLMNLKIDIAKKLLLQPNISIKDIAYRLSYSEASHFSREFKRLEGITPRQYIEQNK